MMLSRGRIVIEDGARRAAWGSRPIPALRSAFAKPANTPTPELALAAANGGALV